MPASQPERPITCAIYRLAIGGVSAWLSHLSRCSLPSHHYQHLGPIVPSLVTHSTVSLCDLMPSQPNTTTLLHRLDDLHWDVFPDAHIRDQPMTCHICSTSANCFFFNAHLHWFYMPMPLQAYIHSISAQPQADKYVHCIFPSDPNSFSIWVAFDRSLPYQLHLHTERYELIELTLLNVKTSTWGCGGWERAHRKVRNVTACTVCTRQLLYFSNSSTVRDEFSNFSRSGKLSSDVTRFCQTMLPLWKFRFPVFGNDFLFYIRTMEW